MGIKETKELLVWIWDLVEGIQKSAEDGQVNFMDVPNFLPLIQSSTSAFGGIQKVTAEILDLDDAEQAEIVELARNRFDIPDDMLERRIEDSIDQALSILRLSQRWAQKTA